MSQTLKDITDFIKGQGAGNAVYCLQRQVGRATKVISVWKPPENPSMDTADIFHDLACKDLKSERLAEARYKIEIRIGMRVRSKYFTIQRKVSPEDRCDDCKGSGWYVGIVERRVCPTCDGSGEK